MNVFVPLFIVVVVCWFLFYTGRVEPTDPRLLLSVGGAMAAGAAGRGSYIETVVCARVPGTGLPRFALKPKGFWPWLSRLAGGADVEVSSRPGLSRLYSLRGEDAGAVRRQFEAPALTSFFEAREALSAEGEGERLVFYCHGVSLPHERLRPFIDESLEAVRLFAAALD